MGTGWNTIRTWLPEDHFSYILRVLSIHTGLGVHIVRKLLSSSVHNAHHVGKTKFRGVFKLLFENFLVAARPLLCGVKRLLCAMRQRRSLKGQGYTYIRDEPKKDKDILPPNLASAESSSKLHNRLSSPDVCPIFIGLNPFRKNDFQGILLGLVINVLIL